MKAGRLAPWLVVLTAACAQPAASSPPTSTPPVIASASPEASPSPSPAVGPGGLTLDEEVGAVMMAGFRGPATAAVLADWRRRQFGGLLIVNLNHNAATDAGMTALVHSIRTQDRHRLIAATDQEGGDICIALAAVPCAPMPVGESDTARMAAALHADGFDLDLGPVADVCSGSDSIIWGRCYGTSPGPVAAAVGPVVDGIHAARMLSAAKHFPGHGDTTISSETQLPRITTSLATLHSRNLPPFQAAIARGTDFVMIGHLLYPALDPAVSADLSPATFRLLRGELGFRGAILSDDLEMGAITAQMPTPEAAVRFLLAGGDMVMVAHDMAVADATYEAIRAAVMSGRLPRRRLDDAVSTLLALTATR